MKSLFLLSLCCFLLHHPTFSQDTLPSIGNFTQNMETHEGFLSFYWDAGKGRIYAEIRDLENEFLYQNSLPAGMGSNDIGLDRGKLGRTAVVKFYRSGGKVLLIESNYDYRALTDNKAEQRSVEEAFATSVLAGFHVAAESNDKILVDMTSFLLSDVFGIGQDLSQTGQGNYKVDPVRSAVYPEACHAFPQNTELEVILTLSGIPKGRYIREVTPSPELLSLRQRHSFIQLPDEDYVPRAFDPRCGLYAISFRDYASPISKPLLKRYIVRHRLTKKNPDAAISEAVKPIIYYVDPGAPEPVRSALIEGASWWNEAFEAVGYENAFQVKVLPEGADPLDIRYNVIQWVHRRTRGWSYGSSVVDPRTGEIIKGHVSLGSLRVRQDFLIAQGLVAAYESGENPDPRLEAMALARLRQLAAHEVGHTLGIVHNFAASTQNRASVMDYPHPYVSLGDKGEMDFSEAYDVNIGEWDKQTIRFGYSVFENEEKASEVLIPMLENSTFRFMSDSDARSMGSAHPAAHLWDNGENPVEELHRLLMVRAKAMDNFGLKNLAPGSPLAELEEVWVPLFFSHRYQLEAVAKQIAGLSYEYSVKSEQDFQPITMVDPDQQRAAIQAMLEALQPEQLAIPEPILKMVPPRPPFYPAGRENMAKRTLYGLDPMMAAEALSAQVLGLLLYPARINRLVEYQARDSEMPAWEELFQGLLEASWFQAPSEDGYHAELQRVRNTQVLRQMMRLATDPRASDQVKALSWDQLMELEKWLTARKSSDISWRAHQRYHLDLLRRFLEDPREVEIPQDPPLPDGSPIGCGM